MLKNVIVLLLVLLAFPARAEVPKVVVTIAPLAGVAAAVMDGIGTPDLLINGNASPHTYQLKPSDIKKLEEADLVVWVGEGLETSLAKVLEKRSQVLELSGQEGLIHLAPRAGGVWESELEHNHDHDHDHGAVDPHLWLSPQNAAALAALLAERLAQKDPAHAAQYSANAQKFSHQLVALDKSIRAQLSPHARVPFIVFHDAYQYFEKQYGLNGAGAITLSPDVTPSARRIAQLRQRINDDGVVCVLAEPQFRSDIVDTLIEGTGARKGLVNPDASDLPITPRLYFDYMQRLAEGFSSCLKG